MARDEKRNESKDKQLECPRFRQHRTNKSQVCKTEDSKSQLHTNKNVCPVSAASSNLSRNVITNITSQQSAAMVKRRGAVFNAGLAAAAPSVRQRSLTKVPSKEFDTGGMAAQEFKAGPPPTLNSLHRLNQQVSEVKSDLDMADKAPDKAGLKLAEERLVGSPRSNNNFRKTVSKRVDISPEEQLYSSLANLSVSSSFGDGRLEGPPRSIWVASEPKRGRDPEPKLEWFHQPYEGTEIICHASDDMIKSLMEDANKLERDLFLSKPATSLYQDFD